MKTKIQIKTVFGKILFEYEKENNTIKDTVVQAINDGANLRDANLYGANLCDADLRGANLYGANLRDANLCGANLCGADLCGADLCGANLYGANLYGANLCDANLCDANLYGANLRGADLRGADLEDKDISIIKKFACSIPMEGSFIAYKKASGAIVKILIPQDAKRTWNILNRKCRAEFVDVLDIERDGKKLQQVVGNYDQKTIYKVGERTKADSFDDNVREDCSHGIHFFITKEEAQDWN